MIQRRQFMGTLAVACATAIPSSRLLAASKEPGLQWPCDIIQTVPHDYGTKAPVVTGVSLQPNGNQIAIVGDDHYVCIFDTSKKKYVAHLNDHTDWVRSTRFSPNGKLLASAGNDRKLRIWQASNWQSRASVFNYEYAVIDMDFSSDSNLLATVGFDKELRVYDLANKNIVKRMRCECPDNHAVAFSADQSMIAAGGRSGVIRVWNPKTGFQISEFQAHRRRIRSIQFTDSNRIVSCGDDQVVAITSPENTSQSSSLPRHSSKLFSAAILTDDLLATAGSDNQIHLWRISDSAEVGTLKGHTGTVSSLDFAADRLASGSYDTQVRVWKYQNQFTSVERQTNLFDQQYINLK